MPAPDHELTPEDQTAFINYIAAHQEVSVDKACETLNMGFRRKDIRRLRREDPDFDNSYRNARGYGDESVVSAWKRLAVDGVEEPVVSAGKLVYYPEGHEKAGEIVTVRKYSDRLVELGFRAYLAEGKAMEARKLGIEVNIPQGAVQIQSGVSTDDLLKMLQRVKGQPELEAPEGTVEVVDERDEPVQ